MDTATSRGHRTPRLLLVALGLGLSACSSGGGGDGNGFVSAVQDLGLDPEGRTLVVTFERSPGLLTPGNFTANGGQLVTNVLVTGAVATVVWDERVTPTHQVQVLGVDGVATVAHAVTTTDGAAPTFTIAAAVQNPGLGGDTITVQFSGARVIEAEAEDTGSWSLAIDGTALDLVGSVFDLDPVTQTLDVTLGAQANLHAAFTLAPTAAIHSVSDVPLGVAPVAGNATGDTTAPTFVSAEQNLAESEFGFVVDFTFSEAMDPVFSTNFYSFDAGFPVFATDVEQPLDEVLRVTFTAPIVPGAITIDLESLMDAHGNALADQTVPVAAGTTVANAFGGAGPIVTTVPNEGGDTVVATFVQALDPESAEDPARWELESPIGVAIDLSSARLDFDLLAKTLTVTLDDDLITGDDFTFGSTGGAPFPLDVDGEDFTANVAGITTGDTAPPTVSSVTQNRTLDPTGLTLDVRFSEDVDEVAVETPGNYTISSGATVTSAIRLAGKDVVRLVVDTLSIPGEHTVDLTAFADLAGNAATAGGLAILSTDSTGPQGTNQAAFAEEGENNDTITVTFNDSMLQSEVEDPDNWVVESPTGTALDTSAATVVYVPTTRRATLTFDGGDEIDLQQEETFSVGFTVMRDVGGNTVSASLLTGTVGSETNIPAIESAWFEDAPDNDVVHVRFSEPCRNFDATDGLTRYVLRDAGGFDIGGGVPSVMVDADRLGAALTFGLAVPDETHTIDVRGVTDLAGNQMFPVETFPLSTEDAAEPGLDVGLQLYHTESGESNDTIDVVFDRPVSSWGLFDPTRYTLTNGADSADFSAASFSFDGDRTVAVLFDSLVSFSFDGGGYTLAVDDVLSAQGVPMSAASNDTAVSDGVGDVTGPTLVANRTRLDAQDPGNSVLVEFDEALNIDEATTAANYLLGGVTPADTATMVGYRTVRATFGGGVILPTTLDVTVQDLATNASGLLSEAVQLAQTSGPAVTLVRGVAVPGIGGDHVEVTFNQQVGTSALVASNYTLTVNGASVGVAGNTLSYRSTTSTVFIPVSIDFATTDTLNLRVSGVRNHDGIAINPAANINGSVIGDTTAPAALESFVNFRKGLDATVVELRFDEDVDDVAAGTASNFRVNGVAGTVAAAKLVRPDTVRLTLVAPLVDGDEVVVTFISDPAGNAASSVAFTPLF